MCNCMYNVQHTSSVSIKYLALTLVGKIFVLEFNVTQFSYHLGAVLPEDRKGSLG